MSVVGCDFGTLNTVIAVARNRGVDVVCIPLFVDGMMVEMIVHWSTHVT